MRAAWFCHGPGRRLPKGDPTPHIIISIIHRMD